MAELNIYHIDNGDQYQENVDDGIVIAETIEEAAQIFLQSYHNFTVEWLPERDQMWHKKVNNVVREVVHEQCFSVTTDEIYQPDRFKYYWIYLIGPVQKGRY